MKWLRESPIERASTMRLRRTLVSLVASLILGAAAAIDASSAAATTSTAATVTTSVVPMATSSRMSKHCGEWAVWTVDMNDHDSRIRMRIWHYTNRHETKWYCVKVYKMKPKRNRATIGIDADSILEGKRSVRSKGSSVYLKVPSPDGWHSIVRARYGNLVYPWIYLNLR